MSSRRPRSTSRSAARMRNGSTPGSRSPGLVPITRPSSGVRPMVVSIATPPWIAEADAPLPRCSTIWFSSSVGPGPGIARPSPTRTRARCRGSRTGESRGQRRVSRRSRRSWRRRAGRGRRRCRRPRRAGMPGSSSRVALDADHIGGIVQRREHRQLVDRVQHVVGDQGRLARTPRRRGPPGARPRRFRSWSDRGPVSREHLERQQQTRPRDRRSGRDTRASASAASCTIRPPSRLADPSRPARTPTTSAEIGVHQLILDRRRAAIEHQDGPIAHLAVSLRLDRRDRDGVDDVRDQRAAREVVDRFTQPLQHRADRDRTRAALHRLVGVVAGVEVGEDEHRGLARPPSNRAASCSPPAGSIAASYWIGPSTSSSGRRSRTSSVAARTLSTSAPVPDSPVEYDSIAIRGSMPNWAAVPRGRDRDVGQLLRRRVGHHRAVAVGEHPIGQAHQEHARHRRDAGLGLDDLERGPDRVRGGVRGAGDHAVGDPLVAPSSCRNTRCRP